jgi:transcriptional regulator with XRE-family HTH domain
MKEPPCYGALLNLTIGRQLRAARALLGWDQLKLAKAANVAVGTIRRMEAQKGPIKSQVATLYDVEKALEKGGVELLNDDRPGVRLKSPTAK